MPILRQIAQLGQPVLRGVAGRVADPRDPAVQALIDDLLVTVADANGVGIAAPQVFEPLSLHRRFAPQSALPPGPGDGTDCRDQPGAPLGVG
jgi:hypothetical protein